MKKFYLLFIVFLSSLFPQLQANVSPLLADAVDVVVPKKSKKTQAKNTTSLHQKTRKNKRHRLRNFLKKKKTKRVLLAIGTLGLFGFFAKRKKRKRAQRRRRSDQEGTRWLKILIGIIFFGGLVLAMPWLLSVAGINVKYWVGILIGVGFAGLIALSVFREFYLYDGATNY